ncbi:hypothetical protein POM88_002712 [Heracleum sosnowskyi]|uniref:Disease resistance protein At4g27190-like leucine-rich repeats domain-containing protein n=1 Tax=Heracleum sosnowskyi TaxID=360622 RepID=A0AAD8JIG5_9APIA|nr:hypothetical protein POM88_002712 [Heracleum sosnowskyi]
MHVCHCMMMREIIGAGEEEITEAIIVFPELTVVEFPNLVKFELTFCDEINLDTIELGRDDSTCQLRYLAIGDSEIQIPSKWQLRSHNLETLKLADYLWCHELQFLCFKSLKVLRVHGSKCSTLFKVSVFRSLQQLRLLEITNCQVLEEIVEEDVRSDAAASGMDNNTITLLQLQLESITFQNLINLKSFSSTASYIFNMPKLHEFIMLGCPQMQTFTSLKTCTGEVSVYTDSHTWEDISDLNEFISQNRKRPSASDNAALQEIWQ